MKKIITSFAFLLTLGYVKAAAAVGDSQAIKGFQKNQASEISRIIADLISYAIGIAGLVSLVYIIIGGFNYITSSGNADKVKVAQKTITYAIIGLAVVVLAFALRAFVFEKLQLTNPTDITI